MINAHYKMGWDTSKKKSPKRGKKLMSSFFYFFIVRNNPDFTNVSGEIIIQYRAIISFALLKNQFEQSFVDFQNGVFTLLSRPLVRSWFLWEPFTRRSFRKIWAALSLALTKNISAHFALTKSHALFLRSWKSKRICSLLQFRAS